MIPEGAKHPKASVLLPYFNLRHWNTLWWLNIAIGTWFCNYINIPAGRYSIRESVDSLCRDGADRTRPFSKQDWPRTPKRGSYKPFWTHTRTLRVILYLLRPSKYVKYTATMTYGSCHTSLFGFFVHHLLLLLLQLNWPTAKAAQVPSLVFT